MPRPGAVDLDFEREAQEDPDHDDGTEHRDPLEGGLDHDRPDDVGDDEYLEAEQDGTPDVLAELLIGALGTATEPPREQDERAQHAEDHDRGADALDDVD